MDETTLLSLSRALEATPDNADLRGVLIRARLDRDDVEAAAELAAAVTADGPAELRRAAAEALLADDRAAEAVELLAEDDPPEALLLRARALLAADRQEEGLASYRRAVEARASLEDPALEARLGARTVTPLRAVGGDGSGRPKLRVISNDDTTANDLDRLLEPEQRRVDFSDVGGLEGIKSQIRKKIILPFQKPSLFARFRKKVGGGILLYGPPGCGKTLLARATAGECSARFFDVAISDVLDMYIGESEQKLHSLFEKARESPPSVLFFDEIEALGGKRQHHREATSAKLVSQFLAEMDGFAQNNEGLLVLGATNVPWAVDPAFRRPGRFDRLLFVPPPDRPAREEILHLLLRDRPTVARLDVAGLAQKTSGFSGADLENLVETAVDEAIEDTLESGEEQPITDDHLRRSLRQVRSTTLEWLTTARNYARYANEGGQYDEVLEFLDRHGKR